MLNFTEEQSKVLPFQFGCPVWHYDPSDNGKTLRQGVVESASMDMTKPMDHKDRIVYGVSFNGKRIKSNSGSEQLSEQDLAYGSQCSVFIRPKEEGGDPLHGTILLSEKSPTDATKFVYTVMILMEGNQARFEDGVECDRIKYREVTPKHKPLEMKVEPKAEQQDVQNQQLTLVPSASSTREVVPPPPVAAASVRHNDSPNLSAITCDTVTRHEGSVHNRSVASMQPNMVSSVPPPPFLQHHQQHYHHASVASRATERKHTTTHHDESSVSKRARLSDYYSGESVSRQVVRPPVVRRMDIYVPLWLQKDRTARSDLFCKFFVLVVPVFQ